MDKKTEKPEKNKPRLDHPHAKLFAKTFEDKSSARKYLQAFLPAETLRLLNFRTFKREPVSYVDEKLKEHIADIIYSCRYKNSSKKTYLNFLWEHKSWKPKFPHVQLLRYLSNGYSWQEENEDDLSLIIPLLLYHGQEDWEYKSFWQYFDLPDESLRRYLPDFFFLLTSLKSLSKGQIMALEIGFLVSTFLMFKFRGDKQFLLAHSEEVFIFATQDKQPGKQLDNYIQVVLVYMLRAFALDKKELDFIIEKIPKKMQDIAMSSWDIAVAEGEVKGLQEGLQKGLQKGKALEAFKRDVRDVLRYFAIFPEKSMAQIADLTEQPLPFVQKIKAALSGTNKTGPEKAILRLFDEFEDLQADDLREISAMVKKYVPLIKGR